MFNRIRNAFSRSSPRVMRLERAPIQYDDYVPDGFTGIQGWELKGNTVSPLMRSDAMKYGGLFGGSMSRFIGGYDHLRGAGLLEHNTIGYAYAQFVSVWVDRCVTIRNQAIARIPFEIYVAGTVKRGVVGSSGKPYKNHPMARAIKRNRQHLIRRISTAYALFGESFIEKATNQFGYPADLYWLNNLGMYVAIDSTGIFQYQYTPVYAGTPVTYDPRDIGFYHNDNVFDDLRGKSPLDTILDDVGIDQQIGRVIRSFYINDARPAVLLIPKNPVSPTDMKRFLETWKKDFQGPNNAGKPAFMPWDLTVSEVQKKPSNDDTQLRENIRRVITAGFGVPLSLAGAWDDAKYQSLPEQRRSLYEETIIPFCEDMGDFMNTEIMPFFDPSGNAEFGWDFSGIMALVEESSNRYQTITTKLTSGLITRNEARDQSGDQPLPGGDVLYIPSGMQVVPAEQRTLVTQTSSQVTNDPNHQVQASTQQSQPSPMHPEAQRQLNELQGRTQQIQRQQSQAQRATRSFKSDASPDEIASELKAWMKKVSHIKSQHKHLSKGLTFECEFVPQYLQDFVRFWLKQNRNYVGRAWEIYSTKAYDATANDFANGVANTIRAGLNDIVTRRSFGSTLRSQLRSYGVQAYLDGMSQAGETFTQDDLLDHDRNAIDSWAIATSSYVTDFADRVFAGKIGPDQVQSQAQMWANKSLREIYQQGLVKSYKLKRVKWVMGATEQHCEDCARLNGQIHRYIDWYSRGWTPGSDRLHCKGFNCDCSFQDVGAEEKSSGNF